MSQLPVASAIARKARILAQALGVAWGLKTIESFHTHGTPVI